MSEPYVCQHGENPDDCGVRCRCGHVCYEHTDEDGFANDEECSRDGCGCLAFAAAPTVTGTDDEEFTDAERVSSPPLGERLRRLIAVLDMTETDFAHRLGMSASHINRLVSGERGKRGASKELRDAAERAFGLRQGYWTDDLSSEDDEIVFSPISYMTSTAFNSLRAAQNGTDDEEFTDAERVEIADAVIARWQAWRAQWVEKIASDAKHAARVEEARAAMQARVRTLTATTVAEWLALADWWAAKLAQRAGVTRAVVSRHITGVRPMGELAALKVQRAMREAFDAGNVRVKPLTLEQLCPRPPQEPRTIDEWCEAAKITPVELGRCAGLSRAVIWRHRKGIRAMGELAALKVQRAMREAFDAGNVRVKPLTLEQLCPRLSRSREAAWYR